MKTALWLVVLLGMAHAAEPTVGPKVKIEVRCLLSPHEDFKLPAGWDFVRVENYDSGLNCMIDPCSEKRETGVVIQTELVAINGAVKIDRLPCRTEGREYVVYGDSLGQGTWSYAR